MSEVERELEEYLTREEAIQALQQISFTRKEAEQTIDAPDEQTREAIHRQVQERVSHRQWRRLIYHASWFGRNESWLVPTLALAFVFLIILIMYLVNH